MRHGNRRGKLDRTIAERKALLRGLVAALLRRQRITTTLAKAKEARRFAEKIITLGRRGDVASQRRIFAFLLDRSLIKELVSEIAPRFKGRQGGYTRIIKLHGRRRGDNAQLVILELTEQKVIAPTTKKAKREKKPAAVAETPKPAKKEELPAKEQPPQKPPAKEEKEKHPPKEEKKHHIEKPKKGGFFQNIQKFLKPKTGTG